MPQHPVRCPLLIADLRHQSRLHPLHTAAHQGRHLVERHGGPPQRVQGRQEAFGVLLVPAGAHPAGIVQPAVLSVPHHQGAQPVAATTQRRETADHHLLAGLALDLQPSGAAAGAVGLVRALGDQPLGPEPAGMLQEVMPAAREVVTVANELGALQQRREPLLALDQRSLPQVDAVQEQEVERVADDAVAAILQRLAQQSEAAHPAWTQHDSLAVDQGRLDRQAGGVGRDCPEPLGPVVRPARAHDAAAVLDAQLAAIAVMLDLEQPVLTGGRRRRRAWRAGAARIPAWCPAPWRRHLPRSRPWIARTAR